MQAGFKEATYFVACIERILKVVCLDLSLVIGEWLNFIMRILISDNIPVN